jgi:BirA family biotin operon repressor/biotin-[acetyl-CoA-carboxylase] ligase
MAEVPSTTPRLDWDQIAQQLGEVARVFQTHGVYDVVSSTNDWCLQQCSAMENLPAVCLAESQQQGRGRRGREWVSPGSANIYMSLAWWFPVPAAKLGPLALVAGVAVARALQEYGILVQLKWPNDILVAGEKMAGILIESRVSSAHSTAAVIGLGLNFDMNATKAAAISQPWTDFARHYRGGGQVTRNQLVSGVLAHLVDACVDFTEHGFAAFQQAWGAYDMCRGKLVELDSAGSVHRGEALGVDDSGGIQVLIDNQVQVFHSADMGLRVKT